MTIDEFEKGVDKLLSEDYHIEYERDSTDYGKTITIYFKSIDPYQMIIDVKTPWSEIFPNILKALEKHIKSEDQK